MEVKPELINAVEFGGAGAKGLSPILKIAANLKHEEVETLIQPMIIKLFASPDRAIRLTLCENLQGLIEHFNSKIVSDKIFPNLATGFQDTSAVLRESTLKAVLVVMPKV
jgi:SCY1-like protein 1